MASKFECEKCGKEFSDKIMAEKHELTCKKGKGKYICANCGTSVGRFERVVGGGEDFCSTKCRNSYLSSSKLSGKIAKEWKCKCNSCGHVWHYLDSVEKQMKKQSNQNACMACGNAGPNPAYVMNINKANDLNRQIQQLKQCPKCGSSDVRKEERFFQKQCFD